MIDNVLEKLDPSMRKLLERGSDFKVHKQATPSIGLNVALRGGFAYGRQVLIYGSKSAGKSTFCLQMIADAQHDGKVCAWIDAENSFDPEWAARLGVDIDKLIVSRAHKINDAVDIGCKLLEAGVDILVIDSISSMLPAVFFEKKGELKDLADTKQMGADARDWAQAVKMLNYVNKNTLLVLISQQRKQLGSMFVSNIPTGGEAVKFYSSTIIRLFSSGTENNSIKEKVQIGNKEVEIPVAREVSWLIDANKTGPSFLTGKYQLRYDGDPVGIDSVEEMVSQLELNGFATKQSPQSAIEVFDRKFRGRANMVASFREELDLQDEAKRVLGL